MLCQLSYGGPLVLFVELHDSGFHCTEVRRNCEIGAGNPASPWHG
ncbi:hypothetical protein ACFFX0_28020 [Citricoccus parietis]|uniref:Uncharacterized protein n=1 Tax=Citricoccus parietis TaxID=592307 RepID=A0ABV5G7A3_9MICC